MSKTSQRKVSKIDRIRKCYTYGRKNSVPPYKWVTETEYRKWLLGIKHYMAEEIGN